MSSEIVSFYDYASRAVRFERSMRTSDGVGDVPCNYCQKENGFWNSTAVDWMGYVKLI